MKPTDFARHITAFFSEYLPGVKNLSGNTILSYRDAFRLLLAYCHTCENIASEKLRVESFNDKLLLRFLDWLQQERGCSIATRNNRLAAIHAFFRYVQSQEPGQLLTCQLILQVPFKKYHTPIVRHLTPEQTRDLLSAPGFATSSKRRDTTLLSVLYDSGARVQELCDLRVRDVRLDHPPIVTLTGKGHKTRHVPLAENTAKLLRSYMKENSLFQNGSQDAPLFCNQRRSKLTRGGIIHILCKYADGLSVKYPDIPEKLTPHVLRHYGEPYKMVSDCVQSSYFWHFAKRYNKTLTIFFIIILARYGFRYIFKEDDCIEKPRHSRCHIGDHGINEAAKNITWWTKKFRDLVQRIRTLFVR